jgi:hypothetical protein
MKNPIGKVAGWAAESVWALLEKRKFCHLLDGCSPPLFFL